MGHCRSTSCHCRKPGGAHTAVDMGQLVAGLLLVLVMVVLLVLVLVLVLLLLVVLLLVLLLMG